VSVTVGLMVFAGMISFPCLEQNRESSGIGLYAVSIRLYRILSFCANLFPVTFVFFKLCDPICTKGEFSNSEICTRLHAALG